MSRFKLDKSEVFYVMGQGKDPYLRGGEDTPKLAPNGKKTYALGGSAETGVRVHSCEPVRLEKGRSYRTDGDVWIVGWVPKESNFVNYSVVAERLVPVDGKE